MFVKICGITRIEDAEAAVESGASALGFVFWPRSPRRVDADVARRIRAAVPSSVAVVGVFVNQPADEVNATAERVGLTAVQLHGDEPISYVASMSRPVVKALSLGPETPSVLPRWPDAVRILLDVHDPVKRGGTGQVVDWVAASAVAARRDVILAGGLTPANVSDAIARVRPWGIDVSSGVESAPGIKDHERMKALFEAMHGGHYATRS